MQTKGHNGDGSLQDAVERGACVLVLSPSIHDATDDACLDLLSLDDPSEQNVLWVAYTRSPDACIQDWVSSVGERPRNLRFVSVGETTRSASAVSGGDGTRGEVVDALSSPGDLTGLGIKLSEVLKAWDSNDNETVACFDSLTALLQYADLQTVYKFLHVLTGRFDAAGVTAHFHLDPDACDDQTVSTLTSLFDTVLELDDDGEWAVRTR
ncbi:hypothetical protein NGM10_09665 [Halorussus salilacus]|uniref:DUF7504 family protein n=1 Tax=Halorussus salilacus TaxID=2953750 RepID=UPI00209D84E0|nr:hypothetical protein [Halorussus salilacus]USZ66995.1 hypothetical protein NGM10_09665 [Halorussus salilacus]